MKKIVIAGASVYGLKNMSDDAMFSVFCRELHAQLPALEIVLLARHPGDHLDRTYGLKSIKNLDFDSKDESLGNWFHGLNQGDTTDHLQAIWREIGESDLLVIGGGPFIDISIGLYRGLTPYVTLLVTIAKFLNTPVMMNGIHLGRPLSTDLAKEMTRFCIGSSRLGTLREERSRKLFSDIGVPVENLVTTADAGFGLNPVQDKDPGKVVLDEEGITGESEHLIGITFRMMYWLWNREKIETYTKMMAEVADHLVQKYDARIVFIPHCFYNVDHEFEDDRPGAKIIKSKMKHHSRAYTVDKPREVNEILSIFPHLDFIIGNRRHSIVFGAVHGVPGIGIGEEWHIKPSMIELGLDSDLFVSMENYGTERLIKNIDRAWSLKDDIKEKMRVNMPVLREKALMNAKLAADLIK